MKFTRRLLLTAGAAGGVVFLASPRLAVSRAPTDRRFVFIIQRGAADGLSILAPTGDSAFSSLRGALAQNAGAGSKLDGTFTLHPALTGIAKLYTTRQALFAHAVASPYRDRSHFDGQNVLETGSSRAYALTDGWMNRLIAMLPAEDAQAVAVASTVPMVLRGSREVNSYAPSGLPDASDDLLMRVTGMYDHDALLAPLWQEAIKTRNTVGNAGTARGQDGASTGKLAAQLLTGKDGARVALIESGGWDTHSAQIPRLDRQLKDLDATVDALRAGLGATWDNTLVLVATEFGRTVRINGTGGTDHGTATAAMLLGGAVEGGKIVADWPGLGASALYQDRDLKPTMDLDWLIATAISQHYGLDPDKIGKTLFPDMAAGKSLGALIRA